MYMVLRKLDIHIQKERERERETYPSRDGAGWPDGTVLAPAGVMTTATEPYS